METVRLHGGMGTGEAMCLATWMVMVATVASIYLHRWARKIGSRS